MIVRQLRDAVREPRVALLRASQLREADRDDEARVVLETLAAQASGDADLRLAIAYEYDALGDLAAAAEILGRGPQDDQSYALRASLLARAEDKTALVALYDEMFFRMWQFYLAGAEQSFRHGTLVNWQIVYVKDRAAIPMTRDFMYEESERLRESEQPPEWHLTQAAQ